MKNADLPIQPIVNEQGAPHHMGDVGFREGLLSGLSKREKFCLQMGVPETGDPELDGIIRKGERKRIAAMAMQALASACDSEGAWSHDSTLAAIAATEYADALLEELVES